MSKNQLLTRKKQFTDSYRKLLIGFLASKTIFQRIMNAHIFFETGPRLFLLVLGFFDMENTVRLFKKSMKFQSKCHEESFYILIDNQQKTIALNGRFNPYLLHFGNFQDGHFWGKIMNFFLVTILVPSYIEHWKYCYHISKQQGVFYQYHKYFKHVSC